MKRGDIVGVNHLYHDPDEFSVGTVLAVIHPGNEYAFRLLSVFFPERGLISMYEYEIFELKERKSKKRNR
jgi:hypothetical protein